MPVRHNLFIGAVVLAQLLIPLRYYLADTPYDIRFAWRMLLENSLIHCQTDFKMDGMDHPVEPRFSSPWVSIGNRGSLEVPAKMARTLCQEHPGHRVAVEMTCTLANGEVQTVQDGKKDLCTEPW